MPSLHPAGRRAAGAGGPTPPGSVEDAAVASGHGGRHGGRQASGGHRAPPPAQLRGGEWREAGGAGTLADCDPATGEVSALVPLSGAAEVEAAVAAARAAQPRWRELAPQRRARALIALREALAERSEELARLVSADMGKTLADARGEVLRGIESTEAACAIPHLLKGENLE